MSKDLNADKALIFRITHLANVGWILQNGLYSANSDHADPNFVSIGNPDLINRRSRRELPEPFGGVLSDYIPFYFTPFSPMMYNIKTGWGGVAKRANREIVIFVSSIWKLLEQGVPFVFSDRHAYLEAAQYYGDPVHLDQIDWGILQRRDFKRDPDDPGKFERYEAELLVRRHVPVEALLGIACYNEWADSKITANMRETGVTIKSTIMPKWYF